MRREAVTVVVFDDVADDIPGQIARNEQDITEFEVDLKLVQETRLEDSSQMSPMVLEGRTYTDRKDAGSALLEICKAKATPEATDLGSYRGFSMSLEFDAFQKQFVLSLKHTRTYTVALGHDIHGNLQRIDNALQSIERLIADRKTTLESLHVQLVTAKEEVKKPFPQEVELNEKSARLQALNALLNMDQKDDVLLDEGQTDMSDSEREEPRSCIAR